MFADHIDYVGISGFWVPDILQTLRPKYLSWIHLQHSRGIAITFAHWNLNLNKAKILQKIPAGKSDGPTAIPYFRIPHNTLCSTGGQIEYIGGISLRVECRRLLFPCARRLHAGYGGFENSQ